MLCRPLLRTGLLWGLPIFLLTAPSRVDAYPVGPALPLDKLIERADCVCKAVVVSSQPVQDPWFEKCSGYDPYATDFKIVAVYKGPAQLESMVFRHYAAATEKDTPLFYMPQHYEFVVGRTYVVFAAKTPTERVFRQLWKSHTSQEDQGVFLAADREPRPGKTIQQVCWLELTGLLTSSQADDVKYAIRHLDWLSGGGYKRHEDFGRDEVLKSLLPLLRHRDPEIAQAAILAFGSNNPYLRGDFAAGWLATVGKGHIPGYATWKEPDEYVGGRKHWQELAAIVDSDAEAATRALAVRALGRARQSEILPLAERWVRDAEPSVVQAAAALLADFPELADRQLLATLSADSRAPVRLGAARAIGFGQFATLIPTLRKLVDDADPAVAEAAALSLLSFSLDDSQAVLKSLVHHAAYGPLFVNALAQRDPMPYFDELCRNIKTNAQPARWWGGFVIWGDSWEILFRYVQKQSADELKTGKCDALFEALESPATGAPRTSTYYSSSEPRDLYALYLQKGLAARAQAFRVQCKKTMTYDIDYYFKQVDEHPSNYTRAR